MNTVVFQIARICAVLALVCVAAALATPKGRLPLALRGLAKLLRNDDTRTFEPSEHSEHSEHSDIQVSLAKRLLAFLLVLLAILLALI